MISFLSDEIRIEFHLLPVSIQIEINELSARLEGKGLSLEILFAGSGSSEISIRIAS